MLIPVALYACTMLVYLPGLVIFLNRKRSLNYPITTFTFVGMFVFNALGSIFVIRPDLVSRGNFFSYQYIMMLNLQACIFYAIAIPYVACTRHSDDQIISDSQVDGVFQKSLILIIAAIIGCYVLRVGVPPLLAILSPHLTQNDILRIRTETLFGRPDFWFFNLGFTTIPLITAIYALGRKSISPGKSPRTYWIIFGCICVGALPGGKGSILEFGAALLIAYYLLSGWNSSSDRELRSSEISLRGKCSSLTFSYKKTVFYLFLAFIPVFIMYRVYWGVGVSSREILAQVTNRIVGVYSESMAATVAYVDQHGFLNGKTMPTIHGILEHQRHDVETDLHRFMFGTRGSETVSAPAEGYINFGWTGFCMMAAAAFLSMIIVEQFLKRLPRNLLSFTLIIFYSVLATKVSQVSLFATFVSLTYVVTLGSLILLRQFIVVGLGAGRVVPEV